MLFSKSIILFFLFFLLSVFGTLILKVHVQNLAVEVKNIESKRKELNNEIQVLKAEWSYLNNAERVSKLAKKYLRLDRAKIKQVRYINGNNSQMGKIVKHTRRVNTNWRYKSRMGILKISNKK